MTTDKSNIDPITLSVMWSGLVSIADDMGTALRRTAFSEAVREGDDFSTGLFDRKGRLIAQGNLSVGHIGAMPYAVQHVLAHFPMDSFRPGDCIILNDSFLGSGHYPDIYMTSPVFVDDDLVGFAVNSAHHVDMGGAVPGSQIVTGVSEAFQEGLRILPIRIIKEGEIQEDVLRLILGNVRLPEIVKGDLLAQRNTNVVGVQRFSKMVRDYGIELVDAAIEAILDRSEARMRELLSAIPDGVYQNEDFMDDAGVGTEPIRFKVTVTVDGDRVKVDFAGSSEQVARGLNSYINYTRAYAVFAIKVFTDPHLPHNEGVIRVVDISAPEGSFFNPTFPAPSSGRAVLQVRIFETICGALAGVVPSRAMAGFSHWSNPIIGGQDAHTGKSFICYDIIMGGYGARDGHDGQEALCPVFNGSNIPVEVQESNSPIRVRRLEFIQDSGGAGKFRGGCGVRKDLEVYASSATASLLGDRHKFQPKGLFGGDPGALARTVLNPDGEAEELESKEVKQLREGDVLSIQLSGGGGLGDPKERDPAAVREDVADGFVSALAAKERYGVDMGED
ncbi:MAG: hydantoinase B/oxoprolinase family protein [SAR324 cluster bacterium]|nr:hydantoinase B/oxoprolinase family protein [SAR324 cluster bacterium]